MDPNELVKMLASGDPEQVKAAQTQLQASGYAVSPDGKLGPNTSNALAQYKAEFEKQQAAQNVVAEREAATQQADAEARAAEARAREAEQDPTNRLTKLATEVGPYAVGGTAGYAMSRGLKNRFDAADASQGEAVSRIARNRNITPQVAEQQVNRLMRGRNVRNIKQFGVPAAFLGGSEFTREFIAPQFEDPKTREAINLVATGEQGAGITLGAKQLYDMATRSSPIDPEDEALIRSRANPAAPPPAAPPRQPQPGLPRAQPSAEGPMRHSDRLKQTVAAAGGKLGKTKSANVAAIKRGLTAENMPAVAQSLNLPAEASRPQILQRLREISKIGGKMVLPFAAGVLAYDAATSDAEAANGEGGIPNVARGAIAGGTAAGATYAANRLLQAVPALGRAMGPVGAGLSAYDYASKAQNAREGMSDGLPSDLMAQVAPLAMRGMEDAQAWQDLPQNTREFVARNQSDPSMGMSNEVQAMPQETGVPMPARGERGLLGRRDLNAANLEVPQMPAETYQEEAAPPDFDQYIADLQAIFAEMEQGQQPRRPAPRPMPAPPPAYGGQQNRLLQPTGY